MHNNLRSRAKAPLRLTAVVFGTVGILIAAPHGVFAQNNVPKTKASSSGSKAATAAPGRPAAATKTRAAATGGLRRA